MPSIRLSLIVYFLLLLGAALGAVSYFCYQSTQEALAAKEKSTKELWRKQFDENKQRTFAEFDNNLVNEASALKTKVIRYYDRPETLSVGLSALACQPHNAGSIMWLSAYDGATKPEWALKLYQPRPANILIEPPNHDDDHPSSIIHDGQYYQTYSPVGGKDPKAQLRNVEHSRTLSGFLWNLSDSAKSKADLNQTFIDELSLPTGQRVRRVTIRTGTFSARRGVVVEPKSATGKPFWNIPAVGEDRPYFYGPGGGKGKGPPGSLGPPLVVYLQYGKDTASRDKAIGELQSKLDDELADLHADLEETRVELRRNLLWIALATFAAVVLGGLGLVALGLRPLKRLSDAVSKVSEKDFRLPIKQDHLPTELKPIAGRLAETLEQLKHAFEREKQAAADISHELRTPVAALLTTLDITLRKQRSAEEYREVLVDCRSSGQQISHLVERLLTIARLDAGADVLRPQEVDVAALADQCVALVRPLAEARGVTVTVHSNGPASVNADPDKLRELLNNLLHNAIEYNRPKGTIDVEVERSNGVLKMEVRDTGIGIAPEAQQRIFERFFRVDPSRHADDAPHTGLGLAIVKGYVDLMGGAIDVESKADQGSTFRVRLPVR